MTRALLHRLARIGILSSSKPRDDIAPAPADPSGIPGGSGARELRMLPKDWDHAAPPAAAIVQLKADGIGGVYVPGAGIVTLNGVPLNCALHCVPGLERLGKRFGEPMVFDGEYVEEAGFKATQSAFRRGVGSGVFWVYDAVPFADWSRNAGSLPIETRLARLMANIHHAESMFVGALEGWPMTGHAAIAKAQELWQLGYEGIVAKKPGSLYRRERSGDWRRLKREVTDDCQIVDVLAKGGIVRDIMVRGPEGSPIRVAVPAGFADLKMLHAGRMVEIARQPVVGGGTRAARLVRVRDDKRGRS